MSSFIFANNATTTLAGAISPSSLTCNVAAGTGVRFPSPGAGQYFTMTFNDALTGLLYEIVHVTAVSGDTFTMVRAQEGTTALNWLAGDLAANLITAGSMNSYVQQVAFSPTRIITASGVFSMTTGDYAIGLNRTSSLAVSS